MINQDSLNAIKESTLLDNFIKPLYKSYCLSNLPTSIFNILAETNKDHSLPLNVFPESKEKYQKVILFLIDGLGWNLIEKYFHEHPLLKKIQAEGVISKITSQFPSTTCCNVSTIHTGLTVGESGLYEWFSFEPSLKRMICPILYSYARNQEKENLKSENLNLFPETTLYSSLLQRGIPSYAFQYGEYIDSTYSQAMFKGANVLKYRTLPEALVNMNNHMRENEKKSYYFLYFDKIDSIAHVYGPSSPQCKAEIENFLYLLEKFLLTSLSTKEDGKTLFLLTADHGQTEVYPEKTFYLNKEYPELLTWIKKGNSGEILAPAGSCRDLFLHIKEEFLDKTLEFLKEKLKNRAYVFKTASLIEEGFFGNSVSERFLERVGNLVILPFEKEAIWWYEEKIFEQKLYGHHGGLTKKEMEIPLLALKI